MTHLGKLCLNSRNTVGRIYWQAVVLASVLYIIPQIYGMESADQGISWTGSLMSMTTVTRNGVDFAVPQPYAPAILWGTFALFALTGTFVFVRFFLSLGTKKAGEVSALSEG